MSKRVLILGANGMIGDLILKKCLQSKDITEVIAITRKELSLKNVKLRNIIHTNFLNVDAIEREFENIDICYYCLGVYTGAVSNELFFEITVDYTKVIADKLFTSISTREINNFQTGVYLSSCKKKRAQLFLHTFKMAIPSIKISLSQCRP